MNFPITKCLVSGKEQCLEKLERKLQSYFGNQLSIYRSEPFFLEIMPANVNKAQALEKLLKYLKYNRKMLIACGDGLNDISMIEYAGIAVAMGNAQDIVKEKADFITKSNAEDGVANAIDIFWVDNKKIMSGEHENN